MISGCLYKTNFCLHLCLFIGLDSDCCPAKNAPITDKTVHPACCSVDVALREPFGPVSLNTRLFAESDPSDRGQHVLTRQPSKRRAQTLAIHPHTHTHTHMHGDPHNLTLTRAAQICCIVFALISTHTRTSEHTSAQHTQSHTSDTHSHGRHTPELGLTLLAGLNCFVVFLGLLFWGLSWQATGRVYKPPPACGDH